jgi:spore coat polysaccharide biosynthesis protein SpsF
MLQWIIERLKASRAAETLILATTELADDRPLVDLARSLAVDVFCGSEQDVLDRYVRCARAFGLTDVVRATGDNPFVDADECDRLTELYRQQRLDFAMASNEAPDGFPTGVGVEAMSLAALERSWREGLAPHHREHVDEYILEHPELFAQQRMAAPPAKRAPELSLTVDTPEQLATAAAIYRDYHATAPGAAVPVDWAVAWLRQARARSAAGEECAQ